jgi:hypothetical protein
MINEWSKYYLEDHAMLYYALLKWMEGVSNNIYVEKLKACLGGFILVSVSPVFAYTAV